MKKTKVKSNKFRKAIFWMFILGILLAALIASYWWFQGWNGRDPVNFIVVDGQELSLVSVRPSQKKLIKIKIPPNALVQTEGSQWQAQALLTLAEKEHNPLFLESIGWDLLEVPVDGVIYLSSAAAVSRRLKSFTASLQPYQITRIDLADLPSAKKMVDPDGVQLITVDPSQFTDQLSDWFTIDEIRSEGLSAAVQNASGQKGAGAKLARAMEHSGLRVISVANGQGSQELSVSSKKLLSTMTVKKLLSWFKIKPKIKSFTDRADILIIK